METVLEMLDRAESQLRRYLARLPADQRTAIDQEITGLLRMARAALPRELHHTSRLVEEAEVSLARAREEARRIVLDAQAHARTIEDRGGLDRSTATGQSSIEDARRDAERLRRDAEEYADAVLERLEVELSRVLTVIRRGREMLRR